MGAGCCASRRHSQDNVAMMSGLHDSDESGSSANSRHKLKKSVKLSENDYRTHIIRAYIHEIRISLQTRYNNTEFDVFLMGIPSVINEMIGNYY